MMNKSASQLSVEFNLNEINNNLDLMGRKNDAQVCFSPKISCEFISSEEAPQLERKASLEDVIEKAEDKKLLLEYCRGRSMSDGAAVKKTFDDSHIEIFPSLPNSVLEKMGLHGNNTKERRFREDEMEEKFTSLALAFEIDSTTIKDRCDRQKRKRDQAEINLSKEIEKLKDKLTLLQPLCTDFEKAELLSTLFTQLDTILKATSLVSAAAERYGSVQHEDRLAESVHLMVNHVQTLKQQRDTARQYTKRALQGTLESPASSPALNTKYPQSTINPNRKIISTRRASIATIPQEKKPLTDVKKVTRRTSDLSPKASSLTRSGRPPIRLELGGELLKIKEGIVDPPIPEYKLQEHDSESEESQPQMTQEPSPKKCDDIQLENQSFKQRTLHRLKTTRKQVEEKFRNWNDDGTVHEICCFGALICFSFSLLLMVNILIEYEFAKRGLQPPQLFWSMFST